MDLVEFTREIVESLVVNTDGVTVKEFPTDEENTILIQVMVDESDMGRVIGKKGKIANSIKSLIQAKAYNDGIKNLKINIDSF